MLPPLLGELERQTVRPDEVVLAISGVPAPPKLPGTRFPVRVATDPTARNAAANRNRALSLVTGTVVVYQDADDIPHAQRLEIIRHLFACYEIDHLMHGYEHAPPTRDATAWRAGRYELRYTEGLLRSDPRYRFDLGITNGNPAVSRELLRRVGWPEQHRVGEDVAFNTRAYKLAGPRCATLPLPLLLYRQHLSATRR